MGRGPTRKVRFARNHQDEETRGRPAVRPLTIIGLHRGSLDTMLKAQELEALAYLGQVRQAMQDIEDGVEVLMGRCRVCRRLVSSRTHWRAWCSLSCRRVEVEGWTTQQ